MKAQELKWNSSYTESAQKEGLKIAEKSQESQIEYFYELMRSNPSKSFTQDDIEQAFGKTNIASRIFSPLLKCGYILSNGKIEGRSGVKISSYVVADSSRENVDILLLKAQLKSINYEQKLLTAMSNIQKLLFEKKESFDFIEMVRVNTNFCKIIDCVKNGVEKTNNALDKEDKTQYGIEELLEKTYEYVINK